MHTQLRYSEPETRMSCSWCYAEMAGAILLLGEVPLCPVASCSSPPHRKKTLSHDCWCLPDVGCELLCLTALQ